MNKSNSKLFDLCIRGSALSGKFLLIFMIAKMLTSTDVGFYGLYTGTISIVLYFVGLDFYTYSTREILLEENKDKFWSMVFNQFCFFVFSYIITAFIWKDILSYSGVTKLYLLGFVILLFEHISQEIYRLLIVIGQISRANFQLFIRNGIWAYICSAGIFFQKLNLEDVFIFWMVFSFLSCVYGAYILNDKIPIKNAVIRFDYSWIIKGLKVSAFFFIGTIFLRSINYFDKVLALKVSSLSHIGIYVFYFGIGSAVQSVLDLMVIARTYPGLVQNIQNNNKKVSVTEIKKFRNKIFFQGSFLYLLSIPACYLVVYLTGKYEYIEVFWWYLVIVISNSLVNLSMPYHYQLYAQKFDKQLVLINMLSFIVFITIASIGINFFATQGMSIILLSLLGNGIFSFLMKYIIAQKKHKVY